MWPSQEFGEFYSRIATRGRQEQASLAQSQASTHSECPKPRGAIASIQASLEGTCRGGGREEENCSLAEAREPQGWLVLTLHLTQHSLTPLAGTPRPRAGRASQGHTAKAGRHRDTQLPPADLFVPSGEGPTVEGSREGEKQNRRLEAKTSPKDGCCGLSSGPPGLSLKRLPVPSPLLLHRGLEPQWP